MTRNVIAEPIFDAIPQEITKLCQWVVWKNEVRDGNLTKIPYIAATGRHADSTNAATWTSFERAQAAYRSDDYDGVGFVFRAGGGLVGIDLDKCVKDGVIADWARAWIERLDSYTEISPSGTGVKIIIRGSKPTGVGSKRGNVECYEHSRFFTVTGNVVHGAEINDRTEAVAALCHEFLSQPKQTQSINAVPSLLADDKIIELARSAKNSDKFCLLWAGSTAAHGGDDSSADLALCSILSFYCGADEGQIDRLFRRSGLYREKWDRTDYRNRTIKKALAGKTQFYSPGVVDEPPGDWTPNLNPGTDEEHSAAPSPPNIPPSIGGRICNAVFKMVDAEKEQGEAESGGRKKERIVFALPVDEIANQIQAVSGGWPRQAGGELFAPIPYPPTRLATSKDVRIFRDTPEIFAWLKQTGGGVYWVRDAKGQNVPRLYSELEKGRYARPATLVTQPEMFAHLAATASPHYAGIEFLPHEPNVDGLFYMPCDLPPSTGEALETLIESLNPETEADRMLMLAALITPGWGGECGERPAFVFTSDHGRGAGKSKTAEMFASIWGGRVTIKPEKEDWQKAKQNLLADSSMAYRCVLVDNVKGKLHGQELESMLTAPVIDGHKMYSGHCSRPNRFTFYITMNNPKLGDDITDRCVVIKVGKQKHGTRYGPWVNKFVRENRRQILADIYDMLRADPVSKINDDNLDRWAAWMDGVLSRVPGGNDLAALIKDRRPAVNADASDAAEIRDVIEQELIARGHDPSSQVIRIDRAAMTKIMHESECASKQMTKQAITTWIKGLVHHEPLRVLFDSASRKYGRCWLWIGETSSRANQDPVELNPPPYRPPQPR